MNDEDSLKARILQVTGALQEGGVERGTLEMAAYIAFRGAESHVASSGGKLSSDLQKYGTVHHRLPLARRTPWAVFYSGVNLARIIRENNIDLVHARSRSPAWAALLACRLTNTRMVTTFHGTYRLQNRFKRFYNSVMVRGERVIAISEFIRKHIVNNYRVAVDRIDVAPRGFDPELYNPGLFSNQEKMALRSSLRIKPDEPIISMPGRLTRWKGQTVFLKALGEVQDLPWKALFIGGAGKKEAYLTELKKIAVDLGIEERVNFLGSQSNIVPFYAISDLVVSASTEPEAFGRIAIEAQAMAKPIIASAHGGSLETVRDGETGWLCEVGCANKLSESIRLALSPETDLKIMGQKGKNWVSGFFTLEQMCRKEWAAYEKILQRPN